MLFNETGAYVLVVGLASVFVLILLLQKQRGGREVSLWLFSGLVGALLGAAGGFAVVTYLGLELHRKQTNLDLPDNQLQASEDLGMMAGMGGGPGGPAGGGGFGGPRSIPPKRQLTTLVRKLELLTGDIALTLSQDQAAAVLEILAEAEAAETMTEDEAQKKYDALLAVFNEEQTAKQEKIRLPRSPRGGMGGGPRGMGGAEEQNENANPLKQAPNAEAVATLSQRLGGGKNPPPEALTKEKSDP